MNLATKIYSLRKQNGLSQEELAEQLNVSRQTISKWELGESIPDTDSLTSLAKFFDTSLDYLVFDKPMENQLKFRRGKKIKKILFVCGLVFSALLLIDVISFIVYCSINGLPN